ncbi:3569_t:CDS:2, partial [Dentiscutata heterogama]
DTYHCELAQIKGLLVQLPIFYRKEKENIIMWLLQDIALQLYLNKIQGHENGKLFETWKEFEKELRNILGQVESIDEADKILNFVEGLKFATKVEVNY